MEREIPKNGQPLSQQKQRLRAVRNSGILDVQDRPELRDIVDTVKTALACPVSVVSILDEHRQVFLAHIGLPDQWAERAETPLTHSFCQHVVDDKQPLIVGDATLHERVRDNLAITDIGVASYMGVPISLPGGIVIGALAAIDGKPREWMPGELDLLKKLGKIASNQIATIVSERRWSHLFEQLEEGIIVGSVVRDPNGTIVDWRYDEVNPAWGKLVGIPYRQAAGTTIRDLFRDIEEHWVTQVADAIETGVPQRFTREISSIGRWFDGYIRATDDDTFVIIFVEVTDRIEAVQALKRSEERLRLIVQGAKEYAILTIDDEKKVSSWFGGAEETFGRTASEMVGRPYSDIFVLADRKAGIPDSEIATAARHGVAMDRRWHEKPDGTRVFLDGTVRPISHADGSDFGGFIKIARNATAEKLSGDRQSALLDFGERIRELDTVPEVAFTAAEIMARTLEGATRAGYGVVDAVSETVQMLPDWCAPGMFTIAGLHHFRDYGSFIEDLKRGETVIIADVAADPRTSASAELLHSIGISTLVNVPIIEHGTFVGVMFVHYDRPPFFSAEERDFVRTIADRTREAISRIRAEEEQQLLNHEISHRLKNTMAMVQAIATQTLRPITDRGPVEAFTSRLHALSKAHEVLLTQDWSTARMVAVIDSVLSQLSMPDRYTISGADLELGPRTALSLALLMHKLGTNAMKYGAWSNETGHVAVQWRTEGENGDDALILIWQERNGPLVSAPSSKGFGSKLIRLGLMGTGGVEISYDPFGLNVEMRGLVSQLRQS